MESPFRGPSQNILAFCIDTGEFFFLDIGKDVYGLYWSYVENVENRIYALCSDGIYALFEGNDQISGYLVSKKFDLGKPSLEKNFWIVMLPVYFISGNTNFVLEVNTEKGTKSAEMPLSAIGKTGYQFLNQNGVKFAFTQNDNKVWAFYNEPSILKTLIFLLGLNGIWGEFVLQETSNAVYELTNMHIKTQLGRDVF